MILYWPPFALGTKPELLSADRDPVPPPSPPSAMLALLQTPWLRDSSWNKPSLLHLRALGPAVLIAWNVLPRLLCKGTPRRLFPWSSQPRPLSRDTFPDHPPETAPAPRTVTERPRCSLQPNHYLKSHMDSSSGYGLSSCQAHEPHGAETLSVWGASPSQFGGLLRLRGQGRASHVVGCPSIFVGE